MLCTPLCVATYWSWKRRKWYWKNNVNGGIMFTKSSPGARHLWKVNHMQAIQIVQSCTLDFQRSLLTEFTTRIVFFFDKQSPKYTIKAIKECILLTLLTMCYLFFFSFFLNWPSVVLQVLALNTFKTSVQLDQFSTHMISKETSNSSTEHDFASIIIKTPRLMRSDNI